MRAKLLGAVLAVLLTPPAMLLSIDLKAAEPLRSGQIAAPSQARADDMPRWSGVWTSVSIGYAIEATDLGSLDNLSLATHDLTFGVAVGADHRFAGTNLVVGIGADMDWSRAESAVASFDRQWSIWGRAGVLLTPHVLAYGLAGYTSIDGAFAVPNLGTWEGLTLGGGLEIAFRDNWFVGLEGRWVDLGGSSALDADSNQYSAKLRLGYRFPGI